MITWSETRARMREDRERIARVLTESEGSAPRFLWMHPCYQCAVLHRLSHYCFRHGHPFAARFIWHLNLFLTGGDISMLSDIGGGFVALHPSAVTMVGTTGRNCTVIGPGGIGGGTPRIDDIGAGPGLPVLGDGVTLAPGSLVVGPIRVGHDVFVGAGAVVSRDIADGASLAPGWHPSSARPGELANA
jgi:serine O-acetyltransferase